MNIGIPIIMKSLVPIKKENLVRSFNKWVPVIYAEFNT